MIKERESEEKEKKKEQNAKNVKTNKRGRRVECSQTVQREPTGSAAR